MQLSEEQLSILRRIHDSEGHAIAGIQIRRLKIDFPDLYYELEEFIEMELVEYEEKENRYYLAYGGFEQLERKPSKIRQQTDYEQYQEILEAIGGRKVFQKKFLLTIFSISFLVTLVLFINPEFAKFKKQKPIELKESTLDQLKEETQEKLDSIQDSNDVR